MKKKVLFVIPTLRMGGAEKSLVSLLRSLNADMLEVDLLLLEAGGVLQGEVPQWVRILEADPVTRGMTLEMRYYFADLLRAGKLAAAASRLWITLRARTSKTQRFSWPEVERHIPMLPGHYDVAIGYLEGTPDFYILDKVHADRKIGWIHSDLSGRHFTAAEQDYYSRLDALVTISQVCRDGFLTRVPQVRDRMYILENIVVAEDVQQKAAQKPEDLWNPGEKIHLVSVGRLDHHKGMDIAAAAAKELADRNIDFCWHVYGQGVMHEEIQQFVSKHGLQGRFVLEGLRKNPYPYMKQADILVQPSRLEGKSIVLDEAKILGKAIVVTNYPSVTDQITHQKTGIITQIDPVSIADGVQQLIQDPALKKTVEENALLEPNTSIQVLERFYKLL